MTMKRVMLVLALVAWSAPAPAATVAGAGSLTCGAFVDRYQNDPVKVEAIFYSWTQGYLSGINATRQFVKQKPINLSPTNYPPELQISFVVDYCKTNLQKSFSDAAIELFIELGQKGAK